MSRIGGQDKSHRKSNILKEELQRINYTGKLLWRGKEIMILNEEQAVEESQRQEKPRTCEKLKVHFGIQNMRKKMETDAAISNYLKFAIQEIGCF